MNTETKKLTVDRVEEGIVVAFSAGGEKYTFSKGSAEIKENDICEVTVNENGEIAVLKVLTEETEAREQNLRSRLNKLFNK